MVWHLTRLARIGVDQSVQTDPKGEEGVGHKRKPAEASRTSIAGKRSKFGVKGCTVAFSRPIATLARRTQPQMTRTTKFSWAPSVVFVRRSLRSKSD